MVHVSQRLAERGISISDGEILTLCHGCKHDTALVLGHYGEHKVSDGYIGSNGDLVILIVRSYRPVTIMYRRSNQPLTACALRVDEIIDRSTIQ